MLGSEAKRFVDRIREAKESSTAFITREWVARHICRNVEFVKNNWKRYPDCNMRMANKQEYQNCRNCQCSLHCFDTKEMVLVIKEAGKLENREFFAKCVSDSDKRRKHRRRWCDWLTAKRTQEMLRISKFDFLDTAWPGSCPDLNDCENVGAILKEKPDTSLHQNPDRLKRKWHVQSITITKFLKNMENNKELFRNPLNSFSNLLQAAKSTGGTLYLLKMLVNKFPVLLIWKFTDKLAFKDQNFAGTSLWTNGKRSLAPCLSSFPLNQI